MAYPIAEKFNIENGEMSCIAFFNERESKGFIIYKLDNNSS